MNAAVYPSPYGFCVKFYIGGIVVDDAGPFDEREEAEEVAHRWADQVSVQRPVLEAT